MEEKEYTLVEHLEELRKRLIMICIIFVITLLLGFFFAPDILQFLKSQDAAKQVDWNVFGYTDGISIYVKCALLVAICFTLPVGMHQLWQFTKPGLTNSEATSAGIFIPIAFILFIIGVSFSYFILFPLMLNFMSNINESIGATETYGIQQYFTLMFNLLIPVGLVFELPVIILLLTKLGIVTPVRLRKMRKVSYFILIIVGVMISPPDFVSDFLIIIPLLLLFEISIIVSEKTYKKQLNNADEVTN
ncbi:twin-arginine translocase subunit TatC [Ureibacillus aquaedulcis]|uniref:Sec-independent protein translocase protein TatC n=1 Tax=Ureibacillus aquaedulcis TaxID=3058421 RepID=A0ABT8GPQ7_9BACL|nr:twin-arginine translocase subunit TatC [Ureibacillus sp. BA0131]MDN4493395.1 twin-arginine translocase subunit TatC [Ureibacillus sp. BA0131]